MIVLRVLAVLLVAALAGAPDALAQTGQQLYNTYCGTCHGNPTNNKDGVLGGKDWNIIKLAMDTKPEMTAELRPIYNAGIIDDADFMSIAGYLQTFGGGASASLVMPSTINFGSQAVGVGSAVQTRNVTITGNAAVQLSSTATSSNPLEFPIVSTTCTSGTFVLPPTGSCSISVQFVPDTANDCGLPMPLLTTVIWPLRAPAAGRARCRSLRPSTSARKPSACRAAAPALRSAARRETRSR
ncbi:MAG TPA: hypothetical protein VNB03_17685 [Casimicrobiaceae bacterium]|nr:hypothetical protein [Casimicrobiaceae bacterium]